MTRSRSASGTKISWKALGSPLPVAIEMLDIAKKFVRVHR